MYFYEVAILSSALKPLTYHSDSPLKQGDVVSVALRSKLVDGVVIKELFSVSFQTQPIEEQHPFFYSASQQKLAHFIASYYVCSLGEAYGIITPFFQTSTQKETLEYKTKSLTLSSKQQNAYAFLLQHPVSLLFGDTGSGKTEIYIKLFQKILQEGKSVLLLLPEISLTPQMQQRLSHYFGDNVVMWHSKMGKKQKKEALHTLDTKTPVVVMGARSALFLPIENLGVIVVDEEHDESYKSNQKPRYNARDLSVYLGKMLEIPVVLGSATPSVTSYKKFPSFRLKERFFQTNKTFMYEKASNTITPTILELIAKQLQNKEQTIIFVPTRANFKYLQCKECGEDFQCQFCHVGMSLHVQKNALKCHYCGFMQPIPKECPSCKKDTLISSRIGTAQIVAQLQEEFSDAVIEQFDRDTITTQKKLTQVLERFNQQKIDILVGTQMLTKGHDYHGVTLGVVLGMDALLGYGDYRAREKALSTVVQIAGRSGRKKDATVFIQTFHEEFFRSYLEEYEAFLEEELYYREGLYPPFMHLARILFSDKNATKAQQQMKQMVEALQEFSELIQVVGYGECSIFKIGGKYRYEILLRSEKVTALLHAIKVTKVPLAQVDIDPLDFS